MKKAAEKTHVLEINLISGQGLKPPSRTLRRMQTYAIAWVESGHKIRTRVDKLGGENPTWNDRFLFKVSSEFLARETSGVTVEIYAVGSFKDHLIGAVRLILSNFLDVEESKMPSFTALQVRRPSGRFHGVLNVAALVNRESEWSKKLNDVSAIGFRDLMGEGESFRRRRNRRSRADVISNSTASLENSSCNEGSVCSEICDSLPPPEMRFQKEMNGVRELAAGTKAMRPDVPTEGAVLVLLSGGAGEGSVVGGEVKKEEGKTVKEWRLCEKHIRRVVLRSLRAYAFDD